MQYGAIFDAIFDARHPTQPGAKIWRSMLNADAEDDAVEQLLGINVETPACQLRRSTRLKLLYGALKGYEIFHCLS